VQREMWVNELGSPWTAIASVFERGSRSGIFFYGRHHYPRPLFVRECGTKEPVNDAFCGRNRTLICCFDRRSNV